MTITTNFEIGDVVWYIDSASLNPTSSTVFTIVINVDNSSNVFKGYYVEGGAKVIDETKAFASQTDLANSYLPL
jgi:hypothetical protein